MAKNGMIDYWGKQNKEKERLEKLKIKHKPEEASNQKEDQNIEAPKEEK